MKKKTINAFTLVEMLIVIVIIGILIAALLPRMQAAQGRARDVSRKTALSQIQSAIVVYQGDHGVWPLEKTQKITCTAAEIEAAGDDDVCKGRTADEPFDSDVVATSGIPVSAISSMLKEAGMSDIPADPLKSKVSGLGEYEGNDNGDYAYLVAERNGTENGGFALMAKTEVVGGSNRVVCDGDGASDENNGKIDNETDLANDIQLCTDITKSSCSNDGNGNCSYENDSELRYLIIY